LKNSHLEDQEVLGNIILNWMLCKVIVISLKLGQDLFPLTDFGISFPKYGSATRVGSLLRWIVRKWAEDGRWMELAQDRVQRLALVLAVLNATVMQPKR
jgi:hypothetical protein